MYVFSNALKKGKVK